MLPRLPDGETEQSRAVAPGRLQIRKCLRCGADCVLIVCYDAVRDSEQCRLIAKVPFPRALLLADLALMFFAFFHVDNKGDDEPDHAANSERQADSGDQKDFLDHVMS